MTSSSSKISGLEYGQEGATMEYIPSKSCTNCLAVNPFKPIPESRLGCYKASRILPIHFDSSPPWHNRVYCDRTNPLTAAARAGERARKAWMGFQFQGPPHPGNLSTAGGRYRLSALLSPIFFLLRRAKPPSIITPIQRFCLPVTPSRLVHAATKSRRMQACQMHCLIPTMAVRSGS